MMKPGRIFLALMGFLFLAVPLAMAEARPEDFACRGVALGDAVTEETLAKAFGQPLFHNDRSVFGQRVRYYTFKKKIVVGLSVPGDEVVDIVIKDRDYVARDGVRYGATAYKIMKTYGRTERVFIDGQTLYVYQNPDAPRQRLLIEAEPPEGTLLSMRLTSLPLTIEEAEEREDQEWESQDLNAIEMRGGKIDMSALEARDRAEAARDKRP